jgi:hypothetical protein
MEEGRLPNREFKKVFDVLAIDSRIVSTGGPEFNREFKKVKCGEG